MSNPSGPPPGSPHSPPSQGQGAFGAAHSPPPQGQGAFGGPQGAPPQGQGAFGAQVPPPQGQGAFGGPQGGFGAPQGPFGAAPYGAGQGGPFGPPGFAPLPAFTPEGPPAWVRWVARGALGLGFVLVIATIVGGAMRESTGVNLAILTAGPLGFGIVATLMTKSDSGPGVAKPLGAGCLGGLVLFMTVVFFFATIWRSL